MRLTVHTDYALRLLMLLAIKGEDSTTIQEVADRYGISKNHLMKVAHELGLAGFVETTRGRGGGLKLALEPEEISLGEVVRLTEEGFNLVECFDDERNQCFISPDCKLRGVLSKALTAFLAVLDDYTLADLVPRRSPLRKLLLSS